MLIYCSTYFFLQDMWLVKKIFCDVWFNTKIHCEVQLEPPFATLNKNLDWGLKSAIT